MRKATLLAAILCSNAFGATYIATTSGPWNSTATWGGYGIPANGDIVQILDAITVTVTDARTVGASLAAGNVAIQCNNSGAVVIASGGALTVRGDISYISNYGTNTAPYLTVQAGGAFQWDASAASSPSTTRYSAYPSGAYGVRPFVTTGTSTNHASVSSNAGGGNGYFTIQTGGGYYTFAYTDFLRIGDAMTAAFSLWNGGGNFPINWSALHNTFTGCGQIFTNGNMGAADIFQHDYNTHAGTLGYVLNRFGDGTGPALATGGVREIVGNVFDTSVGQVDPQDFVIHSNYFAAGIGFYHVDVHRWMIFQNNLYRDPQSSAGEMMLMAGDVMDSLFVLDEHTSFNPHGIDLEPSGAMTIRGAVVEHTGQIQTQISAFMITNGTTFSNNTNYSLLNSLFVPNAAGHMSFWLTAPILNGSPTGVTFTVNHNTAIADSANLGGEAVYTEHAGATPTGTLASYENNILWSPTTTNEAYKAWAFAAVSTNICLPANCDYNDGWNLKTDGGGYSGGANGYADVFSGGTPGAHDLNVNPNFVDATRNLATFDSAYLLNTPSPWSSTATYTLGQMVSSVDPTVYGGATINYRWTGGSYQGTSCTGNTQPGLLNTQARACWEWATLYDVRQAQNASITTACPTGGTRGPTGQCLWDDTSIGAAGNDIITVLIRWIRAGFSPGNNALALAGSDGDDIGAMPVVFAAPQFASTPPTFERGVLRHLNMRKGIIR
jgi:hypothetical protein